jgi:serine protease Do
MVGSLAWPARPRRALLVLLLLAPLVATPGWAQVPEAGAPAPLPAGALPESYPWVRLAEALTPAVVNVRVAGERGPIATRGIGSGFVIDPEGHIVTNHHVVDGATSIEVTFHDGRRLPARLVGSDPETDLALLRVDARRLPAIPLGRSSALRVGEPVMAIGNPFGLDHTVTVGIISGTGRVLGAGRFDDFLQTDAAINPGNSGGPLINTRGEAIGIASAIASRSGGFQGIGFAIPIDLAKPIVHQLRTAGRVTRGWLGVSVQALTPELARAFGLGEPEGALVSAVMDGSPAERGGLRRGDVIVRYDGRPVETPRALGTLVAGTTVGATVDVGIIRDGAPGAVRVTIGQLADARPPGSSPPAGG